MSASGTPRIRRSATCLSFRSAGRSSPRSRATSRAYDLSKGTIRFSDERPLPDDVVTRVLELRRAEIDG
jgi:uncharacterized protein YdhG (YjbR/CyaY superfamily)